MPLAAAAAVAAAAQAAPPHVLELANGDRLQGTLLAYAPDGELRFGQEQALEPHRWQGAALRLVAAHPAAMLEAPDDPVLVALRDGDSLPATVDKFDGETLGLATSWGGRFAIPWGEVAHLEFTDGPGAVVFAGPAEGQAWKFLNRAAKQDGTDRWGLHPDGVGGGQQGGCTVDARMPDRAAIDIDITWSATLNFGLGFYADSFRPMEKDKPDGPTVFEGVEKEGRLHPHRQCLGIDLNGTSVSLQVHTFDDQDVVGHSRLPESLLQKTQARVTVRVDRRKGVFALWINGALVERWDNIGTLPGDGDALSFWQYHDNGMVRIKRIVVRSWDGHLREEGPKAEPGREVVLGTDGSRLSGQIERIEQGKWLVKTAVGEMAVPMAQVRYVMGAGREPATAALPTLQATFEGGTRLGLTAARVAEGRLSGRHAVLGDVGIPLDRLQRFEVVPPGRPEADKQADTASGGEQKKEEKQEP